MALIQHCLKHQSGNRPSGSHHRPSEVWFYHQLFDRSRENKVRCHQDQSCCRLQYKDRGLLTDQRHQALRPNLRRKHRRRLNWYQLTSQLESLEKSQQTELPSLQSLPQSSLRNLFRVQLEDQLSHSQAALEYRLLRL